MSTLKGFLTNLQAKQKSDEENSRRLWADFVAAVKNAKEEIETFGVDVNINENYGILNLDHAQKRRFASITHQDKYVSVSYWTKAVVGYNNHGTHTAKYITGDAEELLKPVLTYLLT